MKYKFNINGSFPIALEYLIKNSSEEVLEHWDKLRGSDWYIGTKSGKECQDFNTYEELKAKFEE
jgi:hypothetical protein